MSISAKEARERSLTNSVVEQEIKRIDEKIENMLSINKKNMKLSNYKPITNVTIGDEPVTEVRAHFESLGYAFEFVRDTYGNPRGGWWDIKW